MKKAVPITNTQAARLEARGELRKIQDVTQRLVNVTLALLPGRLRHADTKVLTQIKTELKSFDIRTQRWKV